LYYWIRFSRTKTDFMTAYIHNAWQGPIDTQ
jgi:hypothetical protein